MKWGKLAFLFATTLIYFVLMPTILEAAMLVGEQIIGGVRLWPGLLVFALVEIPLTALLLLLWKRSTHWLRGVGSHSPLKQ